MVPLNPRRGPDDIVYMLNHAEAKAIIVYDALYSLIERVKDKCKTLKHFVSIPATENKTPEYFLDFKAFLDGQSDTEFEQIFLPMMWRVMFEQPRPRLWWTSYRRQLQANFRKIS